MLVRQALEYQVFVVEQNTRQLFNKGAALNIGFLEALNFGDWNCFIFHDPDILAINDNVYYKCQDKPTHVSAAIKEYNFT